MRLYQLTEKQKIYKPYCSMKVTQASTIEGTSDLKGSNFGFFFLRAENIEAMERLALQALFIYEEIKNK